MSDLLTVQLVGIRDLSLVHTLEMKGVPMRTAELVRCRRCSARYWLLVEFSDCGINPDTLEGFDITHALLSLAARITSEHEAGHPATRVHVPYQFKPGWVCYHPAATLPV